MSHTRIPGVAGAAPGDTKTIDGGTDTYAPFHGASVVMAADERAYWLGRQRSACQSCQAIVRPSQSPVSSSWHCLSLIHW